LPSNQTPPVTLIIVRHGETVWNHEMRFQGHGDSPLTALGRAQARAVGQRLQHMGVDRLVSSDLGRTRETSGIIAGYTGHAVQWDARLRERHYGVLEGLNVKEILARHADVYRQLKTEDPDFEIPGGESHRQHYHKNIPVIEAFANETPGTTTVLVAHGGVLENVFRYVSGLELGRPRCVLPTNASLSIIQYGMFYGSTRWIIKTWGDAAHLEKISQPDR